jgi:transcription initiation factor TFIIE subunit alpha
MVIYGYFHSLVGDDGIKVIKNMPEGEVTDEEISKATDVLLNVVRRTLFILYEKRLASYRRERDTDSGWLTYLWKLDLSPIEKLLEVEQEKLAANLEKRLAFEEENVFYTCKNKCGRYLFDAAVETSFLCPECGEDLMHQDNEKIVSAIKKRIEQLKPNI